jgi:hypothetical protein
MCLLLPHLLLVFVTRGAKPYWLAICSDQANLIDGGLRHRCHQQDIPAAVWVDDQHNVVHYR